MKTIIYVLYAVTVLLFSGFARADVGGIVEVGVDEQHMNLHVSGYVPNPCYQTPSAVIVQDKSDPSVLIVRFVAPIPTQMCVQMIKNYSTVVSLRQLAQASELPLENKSLYTVKTEGFDFAMQVAGQELMN